LDVCSYPYHPFQLYTQFCPYTRWYFLQVNIYQCECWGADGLVYLTVPFSQRITIGIQAAAKAFMVPLSRNRGVRMVCII